MKTKKEIKDFIKSEIKLLKKYARICDPDVTITVVDLLNTFEKRLIKFLFDDTNNR